MGASSLVSPLLLLLFPYCFRIVSASGSENDRRTIGGRYENDTGLIRDRYVTDLFSRRSADLVGLRFCFIALKVFEVDTASPCQLVTVIMSVEDGAKLRYRTTECKSIHNRLQSVYNPFIIRSQNAA